MQYVRPESHADVEITLNLHKTMTFANREYRMHREFLGRREELSKYIHATLTSNGHGDGYVSVGMQIIQIDVMKNLTGCLKARRCRLGLMTYHQVTASIFFLRLTC